MKTMSEKEIHHQLRMIASYYEHLEKYEASTIAKIFGMFTITMDRFEPIHVMIMQNVMPNVPNTDLSYVYDMKGSSINREVFKGVSKDQLKKKCPTGGWVLKDLDYIRMKEMFKFLKMS